jgi:hypothetical protein
MEKNLPARPNLDHLRRQAKALLAALEAREPDAVSTVLQHLPAAKDMTADQVLRRASASPMHNRRLHAKTVSPAGLTWRATSSSSALSKVSGRLSGWKWTVASCPQPH